MLTAFVKIKNMQNVKVEELKIISLFIGKEGIHIYVEIDGDILLVWNNNTAQTPTDPANEIRRWGQQMTYRPYWYTTAPIHGDKWVAGNVFPTDPPIPGLHLPSG